MNQRTGAKTQALCAVRLSFLQIPPENTLHGLSGKVIKLKDPQILRQFEALDKAPQKDPANYTAPPCPTAGRGALFDYWDRYSTSSLMALATSGSTRSFWGRGASIAC